MKYFRISLLIFLTGCPRPAPPPIVPDGNIIEQIDILHDVYRAEQNLPSLERIPAFDAIAQRHAENMVGLNHFGFAGRCREMREIKQINGCYENVAAGYTSAESVMRGWMSSRGHRRNILSDSRYIGIGVSNGKYCVIFGG